MGLNTLNPASCMKGMTKTFFGRFFSFDIFKLTLSFV